MKKAKCPHRFEMPLLKAGVRRASDRTDLLAAERGGGNRGCELQGSEMADV